MTAYRTASGAWLAIAKRAEASRAGCSYLNGGYSGLCHQRDDMPLDVLSPSLWIRMTVQLDKVFGVDAREGYYWPLTKAGWHRRVIAATLLHCLARDEEEGR